MKVIYIKYYDANEVMEITPETTEAEIINTCFRAYKFTNEAVALDVYANSHCTWSTLLDDSMSFMDVQEWIKEAYNHIKNDDFDWLEQNFV